MDTSIVQNRIDCIMKFNSSVIDFLSYVNMDADQLDKLRTGYEEIDRNLFSRLFLKAKTLILYSFKSQ
jgi:hypothetical protein